MARETAIVLGDELRLINSYYSNLIDGHKTTIPDINMALKNKFSQDPEKKCVQELCAAHVEIEFLPYYFPDLYDPSVIDTEYIV